MKNKVSFMIIMIGLTLSGCAGSKEAADLVYKEADFKTSDTLLALEVTFTDPEWDGITIPDGQQCSMFGGEGASPEILVNNIPEGANAVTVSFSDRTYKPNDLGGHGIIGVWVLDQQESITIPSVPGESSDLPEGMFIVSEYRSNRGSGGAYLPPCSGGNGNEYYATVQAVYVGQTDDEVSQVLGEAVIELGVY